MEQRNLIIAMALMALIWGVYFAFFAPKAPPPEQAPAQTEQAQQPAQEQQPAQGQQPMPGSAVASQAATMDRETAKKQSPRVEIKSDRILGSIALKGGRIDDVVLEKYTEEVGPSPNVILLSPPGTLSAPKKPSEKPTPMAYFAEAGWSGDGVNVPDHNSLWQADRELLTPETPVTLSWDNGAGLKFTRIFALDADYMFTVTQRVENTGTAPATLYPYARVSRTGTPKTAGYAVLHEGPLGIFNNKKSEVAFAGMHKEDARTQEFESTGGWVGITDKYWLAAVIAPNDMHFKAHFLYNNPDGVDVYQTDYVGVDGVTVAPGGKAETVTRIFAGAKEVHLLARYTEAGVPLFDFAVDWGWFRFLTKPIFYVLDWLYGLVKNFGIAIMLLTVIVKALFLPLANKAYSAMSRMKKLTPQMQALRERYADDRTRLNQEMMALYKREKVNPAAGCLPIIVQIPVFFALYKVLVLTIEMRHAPFFGWIKDLSVPDPTSVLNLFGILPWHVPVGADAFLTQWGLAGVPVIGHLLAAALAILSIGVWPIIMGVTMYLQQKLNPPPPDPIQARMFMMLPIVFMFMLGQFSAGLVIYWAWNNLLSIAQQWVIMRRVGATTAAPAK